MKILKKYEKKQFEAALETYKSRTGAIDGERHTGTSPEWNGAINSGQGPLLPRGGGKVYLLNHHESGRVLKILKKYEKISSRPH